MESLITGDELVGERQPGAQIPLRAKPVDGGEGSGEQEPLEDTKGPEAYRERASRIHKLAGPLSLGAYGGNLVQAVRISRRARGDKLIQHGGIRLRVDGFYERLERVKRLTLGYGDFPHELFHKVV